MDFPSHSSSFYILLGRPWLKVASVMNDWKNDALLLYSSDGLVKVNLNYGCIQPMISRGSETIFICINYHVESQVPSNIR